MRKKLNICSICVAILLMVVFTLPAVAASYSTSWAFNTGSNGNAVVNGASNGVYYSLTTGTAYLELTDGYSCSIGKYYANLWVQDGYLGMWSTKIGTNTFYSAPGSYHSASFAIPKNHSKYYFIYSGDGIYQRYEASGVFYQ